MNAVTRPQLPPIAKSSGILSYKNVTSRSALHYCSSVLVAERATHCFGSSGALSKIGTALCTSEIIAAGVSGVLCADRLSVRSC